MCLAELDRELNRLKIEEKKMITQIKQAARQGNDASTRTLAKSLVRVRQQMTKLTKGKAQLHGVSTQIMVHAGHGLRLETNEGVVDGGIIAHCCYGNEECRQGDGDRGQSGRDREAPSDAGAVYERE